MTHMSWYVYTLSCSFIRENETDKQTTYIKKIVLNGQTDNVNQDNQPTKRPTNHLKSQPTTTQQQPITENTIPACTDHHWTRQLSQPSSICIPRNLRALSWPKRRPRRMRKRLAMWARIWFRSTRPMSDSNTLAFDQSLVDAEEVSPGHLNRYEEESCPPKSFHLSRCWSVPSRGTFLSTIGACGCWSGVVKKDSWKTIRF